MGFMDKLKGAMNAVTGNAAKVTLEFDPQVACAGDKIRVKVSATSTGGEVKSKGVFIDLRGAEEVHVKKSATNGLSNDLSVSETTFEQAFEIAPALTVGANETKLFEGVVEIPATAAASYDGKLAKHVWQIRARLEALGNDPDSGFKPLKVVRKT